MESKRQVEIVEKIYEKVSEVIGAGSELFSMQFPGMVLNYRDFSYDTSRHDSMLTKPYTIAEHEFRLSDKLFDVSPIVGDSNGERLSTTYEMLLNNMIPKLDYLIPFIKYRAGFVTFLQAPTDQIDPTTRRPLSRIELCKTLHLSYLEKKNAWNIEKENAYASWKAKPEGLDGYSKWLSSEAIVRDEELNNYFNDCIVRGHLHEIMTLLGYLNSKSIAEELEMSKQRMRNSARMSLDESMTVYPVMFEPSNWFKALKPNLHPKDLTMSFNVIRERAATKRSELNRAQEALAQMGLMEVDPAEIENTRKRIEQQKSNVAKTQATLSAKYGEALLHAAKIIISVTNAVDVALFATKEAIDIVDEQIVKDLKITPRDKKDDEFAKLLGPIVKGLAETLELQKDISKGMATIASLEAKKAQMESKDWRLQKMEQEGRVKALQSEVTDLDQLLAAVYQEQKNSTEAPQLLPTQMTEEDAELDGMFQDIHIRIEDSTKSTHDTSSGSSTNSEWGLSAWFISAAGESKSRTGMSANQNSFFNSELDIGLRVAKVSFDRGGWFNPSFFKISNAFTRLSQDVKAAPALTIDKVKGKNQEELKTLIQWEDDVKRKHNYALPAYPVALIIAKDITLKFKLTDELSEEASEIVEHQSATSGGIFCFSASSSSASSSSAKSMYHGSHQGYYYIRIPGPQVIGYLLQFTPADNSEEYIADLSSEGDSKVLQAFKMYETQIKDHTKS
ncbi:coiled-coil domain-containing protein [Microvirgula aerodenitrificans]|uniref:coiled-coil domain-containing protein n=1 Tax=Microvirgula aerodenitrificans TaxID=57480 RepID=UPI00248E374F|nr:hypothetical protein [Microvirgula aerodenitrificans]